MATRKITRKVKVQVPEMPVVRVQGSKVKDLIRRLNNPLLALGLVVLVLVILLAWKNKGLFIVAMVNGRPITRLELESQMVSRYGQSSLEELINERIVRDAAAKKGVKVIGPEIDAKEQEIRKRLGDQVSLEQALSQQKMTLADFRKQMELQVMVEKLVADQITISDDELVDYVLKNKETLTATEEAQIKDEARSIIFQQKVNEAFGKLFSNLKTETPVLKFL